MLLWKSCGKMPLGASWWNMQRRNCLATPATFPGINMLKNRNKVFLHAHLNTWSFRLSYLSACPEKLPLDASLQRSKHQIRTQGGIMREPVMKPWSGEWMELQRPTCPQTAWCRAAWEQPNPGSGGWTWTELRLQAPESPHRIPPARRRSPGTLGEEQNIQQVILGMKLWFSSRRRQWIIHRSDMVVGCSSMNSSGAGTNMLTVLGAESKLVFVGPAREKTWFSSCFIISAGLGDTNLKK